MEEQPAKTWPSYLISCGLAIVAGTVVGIVGGEIQKAGYAPVGLLSLFLGALLGLWIVVDTQVMKRMDLMSVLPGWPIALLAAAASVVAQHLWLYRAVMANRKQPFVEMFKPGFTTESAQSYFWSQATPGNVALWLLDACLIAVTATIIVEWSRRARQSKS